MKAFSRLGVGACAVATLSACHFQSSEDPAPPPVICWARSSFALGEGIGSAPFRVEKATLPYLKSVTTIEGNPLWFTNIEFNAINGTAALIGKKASSGTGEFACRLSRAMDPAAVAAEQALLQSLPLCLKKAPDTTSSCGPLLVPIGEPNALAGEGQIYSFMNSFEVPPGGTYTSVCDERDIEAATAPLEALFSSVEESLCGELNEPMKLIE